MAFCFFRGLGLLDTAVRAGLTFVAAYVVMFLVAQVILHIMGPVLESPEEETAAEEAETSEDELSEAADDKTGPGERG